MIADAEELRRRMVAVLRARGAITSKEVEEAFLKVPRHAFVPEVDPEDVYTAPESIFTKYNARGKPTSSLSAPWLHAKMLEAARVSPGMTVLEIGSGGANAALLQELVGSSGAVTTIDIDPDIVVRARGLLGKSGYERVEVQQADAGAELLSVPPGGFDRIIVTTGAADLAPAWSRGLAPEGRLVVPLRFRGLSRTLAFAREGGHLASDTIIRSGFLAMQGGSAHAPRTVRVAGRDVRLVVDDDQDVDAEALIEAFRGSRHEGWTGVELGGQEGVLPRLELWLAGAVAPYGRLRATKEAADQGLVGWVLGSGMPAVWSPRSLAYLILREAGGDHYELGVMAHGPEGEQLAGLLGDAVRRFDREHRAAGEPVVRAYRRGDPEIPDGAVTVGKPNTRLTIG